MLTGKKILIVEDSRTIKLQIKMILEKEGAILLEAGSQWGMFSKIEEYGSAADLIIMDLILNYENGLDLIKNLKENPKYGDIPIMIITEKVDIPTVLQAKHLGVKSYLKKPIKKSELLIRIKKVLQIPDTETTAAESAENS